METSRKRSKTAGAPVESDDAAAAATKIAELQAKLDASEKEKSLMQEKHKLEVNALKSKNDSHLREKKGLKSALQWAYTIDNIPRQHWFDKGKSSEYAGAMDTLLGSFKQIIQSLWMGTVSESIDINFDHQDEDGNYMRANHDELLLPYWQEFAAALTHWSEHYSNNSCPEVLTRGIEVPRAILDILCPAFEQSRIKKVYFRGSDNPGDIADFINKALQANHFITKIGFAGIMFAHEDIKTICSAIKARNARGRFIKRLELSHCFEDGVESQTLTMILKTVVAATSNEVLLCLAQNGMSSREAGVIAEFLSSNPNLTSLNVYDNRFDDADATYWPTRCPTIPI